MSYLRLCFPNGDGHRCEGGDLNAKGYDFFFRDADVAEGESGFDLVDSDSDEANR